MMYEEHCCRVRSQLDDPAIFPQEYGMPFTPAFLPAVKIITKRLFRVYGHIYHCHFRWSIAAPGCCREAGNLRAVQGMSSSARFLMWRFGPLLRSWRGGCVWWRTLPQWLALNGRRFDFPCLPRRAVVGLGEEAHLNTCFRHFVHFIMEFDLVNDEEQAPLREIIREMVYQRGV